MHIKKSLPRDKFTKISNLVFSNAQLSDGAKVLYGFLASMPNGKTIVDNYILKALGISQPVLTRRKKELKDVGLILMVQLAPRVHDLYIGFPGFSAAMVKAAWEDSNDG